MQLQVEGRKGTFAGIDVVIDLLAPNCLTYQERDK